MRFQDTRDVTAEYFAEMEIGVLFSGRENGFSTGEVLVSMLWDGRPSHRVQVQVDEVISAEPHVLTLKSMMSCSGGWAAFPSRRDLLLRDKIRVLSVVRI